MSRKEISPSYQQANFFFTLSPKRLSAVVAASSQAKKHYNMGSGWVQPTVHLAVALQYSRKA